MTRLTLALCLFACLVITHGRGLPDEVLEYAPLLYLHSEESHWPSDIPTHLQHVVPMQNDSVLRGDFGLPLTPDVLMHEVLDDPNVFLTSLEDPSMSPQPEWLTSKYGKPNAKGRSAAPMLCVVVDKSTTTNQDPKGTLDAFYFAFFSFSNGLPVPLLSKKLMGSHVGDWEHSMIRFQDGKPVAVYVSRHGGGFAYTYDAMQKRGKRPILYIAKGSHATYAHRGRIDFSNTGVVEDVTDDGVLLDPTLNLAGFFYTKEHDHFEASDGTTLSPHALSTHLRWGDKQYPESDPRQMMHGHFAVWVDGPQGPIAKNLMRTSMGPRVSQQVLDALPKEKAAQGKLGEL